MGNCLELRENQRICSRYSCLLVRHLRILRILPAGRSFGPCSYSKLCDEDHTDEDGVLLNSYLGGGPVKSYNPTGDKRN
jgi:hypothetical protein